MMGDACSLQPTPALLCAAARRDLHNARDFGITRRQSFRLVGCSMSNATPARAREPAQALMSVVHSCALGCYDRYGPEEVRLP